MSEALKVPEPPRPQRLNRLALIAVLALLGVAVAAVLLTLAPAKKPKAAAEAADPANGGVAMPGFLERLPRGGPPPPRGVPAAAPEYWREAMRRAGAPGAAGGAGVDGAGEGAGGQNAGGRDAGGQDAAEQAALDRAAAAAAAEAGLEPRAGSRGEPPGGPAGERGRAGPPSSREEAYRRALEAPVTPGRGGAGARGGEGGWEDAGGSAVRQAAAGVAAAGAGMAGVQGMAGMQAVPAAWVPGGAASGGLPDGGGPAPAPGAPGVPGATGGAAPGRGHEGFLRGADSLAPAELRARRDPAAAGGSLVLSAGTVLPAALVTAVDSDIAGPLVAQVTQDVFDREQRQVVIPRGSRLIGTYDSQVALGESRLLVAWSRVIFPDGSGLSFAGLPALTRSGEAGLAGSVDNHLARVFGSAVLLSIVSAGAQLSQPQESAAFGAAASTRQVAAAAVGQELSSVAIEMLRRQLQVPPTIRIAAGTRFYVFLRGDVRFAEAGQE